MARVVHPGLLLTLLLLSAVVYGGFNTDNTKKHDKKKRVGVQVKRAHLGPLNKHQIKIVSIPSCSPTNIYTAARCCTLPPLGQLYPSAEITRCMRNKDPRVNDVVSEFVMNRYQNDKSGRSSIDFESKENLKEIIPRANLMECIFRQLGLYSNSGLDINNITSHYDTAVNFDWKPLISDSITYCSSTIRDMAVHSVSADTKPVATFSTDPLMFSQCIRLHHLVRCKQSGKMPSSSTCQRVASGLRSCLSSFKQTVGGTTPSSYLGSIFNYDYGR